MSWTLPGSCQFEKRETYLNNVVVMIVLFRRAHKGSNSAHTSRRDFIWVIRLTWSAKGSFIQHVRTIFRKTGISYSQIHTHARVRIKG